MAEKKPQKSRLAAVYLDNDLVLSKTHAWTYVRIPLTPYEFMSSDAREYLVGQITLALASLVSSSQETVEVHLRVAHRPFKTLSWGKSLNERVLRQDPTTGWHPYLLKMMTQVDALGFSEKEVYLGVCLGVRNQSTKHQGGSFLGEVLAPLKKIVSGLEKAAAYEDDVVSEKELIHWGKKARDVRRTLMGSHLKAVPATANEVAWLIANPLWPEMEQPNVSASEKESWGPGEIRHVAEGAISHNRKWLEIEQVSSENVVETGFVASLAVSRFPDVLHFPEQEPWMHFASALPFPVDFSSRFTIVPSLQVQKDVGKKLADAKDSAQHIAESGVAVPLKVREQLEVATLLEYTIDKDRTSWAYARHRLMVFGRTEEEIADRCKTVMEMYQELGIDITWPTGDQFNLLCESMPGDKVRGNSYYQRQELTVIAGGMATASSDCGDRKAGKQGWVGPYIGYTTSRVANAVMFSPNVAMARNSPPGVCITGAPGGGKALALDTPLPTPSGWTTMGDIEVGDHVFDERGEPCNVVGITSIQTGRPCYKISFDDGATIVADAQHEWVTEAPGTVTTQQIVDAYNSNSAYGRSTRRIVGPQPLTLPDKSFPFDPYEYGGNVVVAGQDYLPIEYRRGSYRQRLALIQGLFDAAGRVERFGVATFPTSHVALAEHVRELLATLGVKTTRSEVTTADGLSLSYEISCVPYLPIFRDVERLNCVRVSPNTEPRRRMIVRIDAIQSVPVKCIQVDSESHQYLAGETLIPTHNSFLAFTLAYQMALQGVWTIYIDPKADAKPMGELKSLEGARVFDLRDGNDGMLDPFAMGSNRSESTLLALETMRLLLGGQVSEEREEALLNAVEIVSQAPKPSLTRVVDVLQNNEESPSARNLGAVLRTIRDLPFARLCFAPTGGSKLSPEDGLTVVTLLGLDLPAAGTDSSDYSYENRLAVSVMYLLTRYARKLMMSMDKDHPKAICIDEAWAITSTPQGAKLIPEVARMGRSHNCALVLVSQNAGDLMAESVTNSLSTKFAFRSQIPGEIDDVLDLFGLDKDQNYQYAIRGLKNGECVMQDVDGRLARVQIEAWDQELFDTFNTNPETRGKPGSVS